MIWLTHFKMAWDSLKRTRVRTFLTALGIAIGVASIALIMSLSGSVQQMIAGQVKSIGANLVVVRPESGKSMVDGLVGEMTANTKYQKSSLMFDDVDKIREIEGVGAVAPVAVSEESIEVGEFMFPTINMIVTNHEFDDIVSVTMYSGEFLSDKEKDANRIVVGYTIAMTMFGTREAVGKSIHLGDDILIVSGVMDEMSDPVNFNNIDLDMAIVVNSSFTIEKAMPVQVQQINVKLNETNDVSGMTGQIVEVLKEARNGVENFSVNSGDSISHPAGSLFGVMTAMLSLVAGVSLIVGGIGVMNIMLVGVAERTREIGIRKAVGAGSTYILLQFLFEAFILSIIGGVMGLVIGYAFAFFVSLITPFPPFVSIEILVQALAVALLVGCLFGLLPAIKAARKDPIDSLKFYR